MKKMVFMLFTWLLFFNTSFAHQVINLDKKKLGFASISWILKNPDDSVVINNGTGQSLAIFISTYVYDQGFSQPKLAGGINIQNCGDTTHVALNSSVVCYTRDSAHPIIFSSDNSQGSAGTYQIERP
jgi:hypothetical protein